MSRIPAIDTEGGTYAQIARHAALLATENVPSRRLAKVWTRAEAAAYQAMAKLPADADTDTLYAAACDAACRAAGRQAPLELEQ